MQHRILRTAIAVTLLASAMLIALIAPPAATPPAGAAAGVGQYSPVEWWPLRGSNKVGCATNSPGPICNGHHGYNAIDIIAPAGQPIYASGAGRAYVYDTSTGCSGYGTTVVVDHGPYGASVYAHLSDIASVVKDTPGGAWVDENTVIGFVGHTGSVSGCNLDHLHFESWTSNQWSSNKPPVPDLKACVGNELRTYPDDFGHDTWDRFPGHKFTVVSNGSGCTGGPTGALEASAGSLGGFAQVRGWTLDHDQRAASTQVHVYVDGPAGSGAPSVLVADRSRPDVAWSFPGAGEAHGFHGAVGGLSPGSHTLYVYAANLAGTPGTDALLGSPTITVPTPPAGSPFGSVDGATGLVAGQASIRGWAADPDVPTTATQVQVFIDGPSTSGAPSALVDANLSRPDVAGVFPALGPRHGFDSIISGIAPGKRILWIYAVNAAGPAGNPLIGVRTVTVRSEPSACASGVAVGPFADVASTHSFCGDIEWMQLDNIDPGFPNQTFAPASPNTRAMIAEQLYNFAGRPAFTPPTTSQFSDVPVTHQRYLQIAWLASTGITTGYDDGTFRPNSPVSRQAMAAFFYRKAGSPAMTPAGGGIALPFGDVVDAHPFFDEIAFLTVNGITTGYDDGTFRPSALITRQAMAAFLHRYATL